MTVFARGTWLIVLSCLCATLSQGVLAGTLSYPIVDTGQDRCFNETKEIRFPRPGQAFDGQDGQYEGNKPQYRDNKDGTVTDLVTGLMWQKTPNTKNKMSFDNALKEAKGVKLAGYDDWRLPTIKELYSLIDFRGYSDRQASSSKPYVDKRYFDFYYGNTNLGERIIDCQYWSATEYVGLTMMGNPTVFGVNFADGRIKGYPKYDRRRRGPMQLYVRYVRGNPAYGKNKFVDNGDGTVTDQATGLTWMKNDSGSTMNWRSALAYAEKLELGGHSDWRLPNAKELQSIVDYTRAPDNSNRKLRSAAISPIFALTNQESYFWTSTTHLEHKRCTSAVYVCFGQGMGYMFGQQTNVHGAGAQRSDPKTGDPSRYPQGRGPQGDDIRIMNFVRCVRGGRAKRIKNGPRLSKEFSSQSGWRRRDRGHHFGPPHGHHGPPPHGHFGPPPHGRRGQHQFGGQESYRWQKERQPQRGQQPQKETENKSDQSTSGDLISRLDKNKDGKVSRSEYNGAPYHFNHLDKNKDGFLTVDETPKPATSSFRKRLMRLFGGN